MRKSTIGATAFLMIWLQQVATADIIAPGFTVEVYANVTDPIDLAFDPAGNLYTGRDNTGSGGGSSDPVRIHRIAAGGAPVIEYGAVPIFDPDSVVFDVAGTISGTPGSVLVGRSGAIKAIRPDQSVVDIFTFPGLQDTGDMEFDNSGRLILANGAGGGFFVTTGGQPTQLAGPFTPEKVRGFAINTLDQIVSGHSDGTIRIFAPDGTLVDPAFATGLTNPRPISGASNLFDEGLYVLSGNSLLRFDAIGNPTLVGSGFGNVTIGEFGPDGALYLAEFSNDRVLRVEPIPEPVPEPASLAIWSMLGLTVAGCAWRRHRKLARA